MDRLSEIGTSQTFFNNVLDTRKCYYFLQSHERRSHNSNNYKNKFKMAGRRANELKNFELNIYLVRLKLNSKRANNRLSASSLKEVVHGRDIVVHPWVM